MITSYGPGNCHFGLNQSNVVKTEKLKDQKPKPAKKQRKGKGKKT